MRSLSKFFREENGAALAEYAVIIAFVAIVCVAAVTLLGGNISEFLYAKGAAMFPPTP
jgi:Flp pilus assembly pilin Flp